MRTISAWVLLLTRKQPTNRTGHASETERQALQRPTHSTTRFTIHQSTRVVFLSTENKTKMCSDERDRDVSLCTPPSLNFWDTRHQSNDVPVCLQNPEYESEKITRQQPPPAPPLHVVLRSLLLFLPSPLPPPSTSLGSI